MMVITTLTLTVDPQTCGKLAAHVTMSDTRVTDVQTELGALVIIIDGSYPRVRAHLFADCIVLGVEAMTWEMEFLHSAQLCGNVSPLRSDRRRRIRVWSSRVLPGSLQKTKLIDTSPEMLRYGPWSDRGTCAGSSRQSYI